MQIRAPKLEFIRLNFVRADFVPARMPPGAGTASATGSRGGALAAHPRQAPRHDEAGSGSDVRRPGQPGLLSSVRLRLRGSGTPAV
ncbi:hypothetical protein GCM10027080_21550 [Pedococcus soli]